VGSQPTAGQGSTAKKLTWDVSRGNTTKEIRWPNDTTVFELHGGVGVNLTLPAGKRLTQRVEKVMSRREGDTVRNMDLFYPAASTEDAYEQARRLGAEWDIDLRNIDAWHKHRTEQRKAGREDYSDTAFTGDPHSKPLGGPGGPAPAIEVLNSFDTRRPVVVNLSFVWLRTP
jgi:hypothetical protein